MKRIFFIWALAFTTLFFSATVAFSADFHVTNATEFQTALDTAETNGVDDVIYLAEGLYEGNFSYFPPAETENKSLTITGEPGTSARDIILDGQNADRVLYMNHDSSSGPDFSFVINGITIQNGRTSSILHGAGIYVAPWYCNLSITNCIIKNSSAGGDGGGIYMSTGRSLTLENNIVLYNRGRRGGGVYLNGPAGNVTIRNNVIAQNSSSSKGGGLNVNACCTVNLVWNTVHGNEADEGGGLFFNWAFTANVYNNIFFGNTATAGGDIYLRDDNIATRNGYNNDYHDLTGSWTASGSNIDAEPLFTYPSAGNYHLQPTSPCINMGSNSAPDIPSTDFEGDTRVSGVATDMGADECIATVWYVDKDVSSSGTGTSWGQAFKTIQEAISAASDNDEIWVKQGVYNLSVSTGVGKAVGLFGGFAGGEANRYQRDWHKYATTVDGQDTVRCFFITDDAIIDGFSIVNGYDSTSGGGIYNYECYPTIGNCDVSDNSAPSGGGIFNETSGAFITNCGFFENDASDDGGGVYNNDDSSSVITNCLFVGNSAGDNGGGIYNDESSPTITNCSFSGNSAVWYGGGIFNGNGSSAVVTNSILWGDAGQSGTEVIYNFSSTPVVTFCDIDQDGYAGSNGNIRQNPLYRDVTPTDKADWDLHLQSKSPCIDEGDIDAAYLPETDFEGDDRVMDGNRSGAAEPDMGADEFRQNVQPYIPLLLLD